LEEDIDDAWKRRKEELSQRSRTFGGDPSLTNDEGAFVILDTCGTGLYHCGRQVSPHTDGLCGPPRGEQCASCQRLEHAMKDSKKGPKDIKAFQAVMREKLCQLSGGNDPQEANELAETGNPVEAVKAAVLRFHERCLETQRRPTHGGMTEELGVDDAMRMTDVVTRLRDSGTEEVEDDGINGMMSASDMLSP